jgi:hypothetical protein
MVGWYCNFLNGSPRACRFTVSLLLRIQIILQILSKISEIRLLQLRLRDRKEIAGLKNF